jgi:hypothetical protein
VEVEEQRAEKGPIFGGASFFMKLSRFLGKNYYYQLVYPNVPLLFFTPRIVEKNSKILPLGANFMLDRIFSPAVKFFG